MGSTLQSTSKPLSLVRRSNEGDLLYLANNLREEDVLEVEAFAQTSPLQALENGYYGSTVCYTVVHDSRPALMFGVFPGGYIWALGTPALSEFKAEFIKRSAECLELLKLNETVLHTIIDDRQTLHKRWLRWLGFEFHSSVLVGPEGLLFWRARKSV